MRGAIILCSSLFIAFVTASPLALERQKDEKPMSVVDVPAGVFEPQDESQTNVETKGENKDATKDEVEIVNPSINNKNTNKDEEASSGEEGQGIFGIRFPSILIIRRPVFQDPFAGFQSPFFSNFNRRPFFGGSSIDSTDKVDKNREPLSGQDSQIDEQKQQNETVNVNNLVQRMHQQINNLFANLFNNDAFARPTFPRPVFSRPFFPPVIDESSEFEGNLDFDKLPANYSNSTSETKMIDGRLVTVNKTVQKISGNNSNGFFHFSVIKVQPTELQTDSVPESGKPIESSETNTETVTQEAAKEKKPEAEILDPKMNEVDRPDENDQVSQEKAPKGVDTGLLA